MSGNLKHASGSFRIQVENFRPEVVLLLVLVVVGPSHWFESNASVQLESTQAFKLDWCYVKKFVPIVLY